MTTASLPFNKDKWIVSAIRRRYLIVNRDGTIHRAVKASSEGVVDASKGYQEVKFQVHKPSGRVYFNMVWMGITKSVLVNRVVALRFLPNPLNLPAVNHIDGDKEHNALLNLEWCSSSENERHAHRTGLKSGRGGANSNAKLTAESVLAIRASRDTTPEELAVRFGVSRSTVVSVLNRKTWTHL